MFDRRLIKYFDWGLLWLTIILGLVGIITLYSAISAGANNPHEMFHIKQLVWYGIGIVAMVACFLIDYKTIEQWSHVIYTGCISLLVLVLGYGKLVSGSRRWLGLGPVSIQPSEFIKIALIFVLARYYSRLVNTRGLTIRELITPIVLTAIPFGLIVRQPDLGTAMLLILIAGSMTVFVKIERRSLSYIVASCTVAIPLVWLLLKDYQKQRILTFLYPERDPLGAGYHIIQSKIAIGSGMISGKGFLKGTQNALSFLPEQHTDFIFSVLAEEWGLIGTTGLLFLFLMLTACGLSVAHGCRDPFGIILAVGVVSMISWQVIINISMVIGLMPVVGVPLPFISYGGSSVVSMMICIGLLMNISMRRFMIK
jgi:rod shape determining protein RodA